MIFKCVSTDEDHLHCFLECVSTYEDTQYCFWMCFYL